MFGLKALFAGLARLASAINRSAELFEAANEQLAARLGIEAEAEAPALGHAAEPNGEEERPARSPRRR